MRRTAMLLACLLAAGALLAAPASATDRSDQVEFLLADGFRMGEGYTLVYNPDKDLNLYVDIPALNPDGTVNAVIEIPAGTNAKFETDTATGRIFWEFKKGKPRIVDYPGYPGNYGMVPRTLGGDGDPLDV